MVQAFTSGAIQGALHERGCITQGANVSSWKKAVVGKGNATKEDVGESIRLRWPALYTEVAGDQDLTDASAIALYGQSLQKS
jgi:Holliday junction resolvasome RuvABC endonuclease subunit